MTTVLILIGVAAIIVLMVVIGNKNRQKHQSEMATWAASHSLDYRPESAELAQKFGGEPFFGGSGAEAVDVVTGPGPNGHDFCSYVYEYTERDSDDHTTTVRRWIVALQMPSQLPWLSVTFESLGTKIAHAVGHHDIALGNELFDKTFDVKATSPEFAQAVLHPQMIDWLLGPGREIVPLRLAGDTMLWWKMGKPDYDKLLPHVNVMAQFIDQIPPSVWHDYGQDHNPLTTP